jgi:hypothetical protein
VDHQYVWQLVGLVLLARYGRSVWLCLLRLRIMVHGQKDPPCVVAPACGGGVKGGVGGGGAVLRVWHGSGALREPCYHSGVQPGRWVRWGGGIQCCACCMPWSMPAAQRWS